MNELLQRHGCANVFKMPEGLKELMSDITREVLRAQPADIFQFIENYLATLLITREHGILAMKLLDELCDCRASVSEHLLELGFKSAQISTMSKIIKDGIEAVDVTESRIVKESNILKKLLTTVSLDEETTAKICQIIRNAYKDYVYRKKVVEKGLKIDPEEPWEIAAQHTLEIYKKTKPSLTDLNRASERIQAAYRGYHIRKNLLTHLKPRPQFGPEVELPGAPIDTADSREIDLGPVVDINVKEDDVKGMFDEEAKQKLGLKYDPMKTLTHFEIEKKDADESSKESSASDVGDEGALGDEIPEDIRQVTSDQGSVSDMEVEDNLVEGDYDENFHDYEKVDENEKDVAADVVEEEV